MLDCLLHYSVTINIQGESYRSKNKSKAGVCLFMLGIPGFQIPSVYVNHIWTRAIDWSALGYGVDGFLERQQAGFLWMAFVSIFYLLAGVGFPTTLVIHRYQYLAREGVAGDEH